MCNLTNIHTLTQARAPQSSSHSTKHQVVRDNLLHFPTTISVLPSPVSRVTGCFHSLLPISHFRRAELFSQLKAFGNQLSKAQGQQIQAVAGCDPAYFRGTLGTLLALLSLKNQPCILYPCKALLTQENTLFHLSTFPIQPFQPNSSETSKVPGLCGPIICLELKSYSVFIPVTTMSSCYILLCIIRP